MSDMTNDEIRARIESILIQMDEIGNDALRDYVRHLYAQSALEAKNFRLGRGVFEDEEDRRDMVYWKDHEARMIDSFSRAYLLLKKMQAAGRLMINPPAAPKPSTRVALEAARSQWLNLDDGPTAEWALLIMNVMDALIGGNAE